MQILLSGHMDRFARMQNLRIRKVEKMRSHGQICLRE